MLFQIYMYLCIVSEKLSKSTLGVKEHHSSQILSASWCCFHLYFHNKKHEVQGTEPSPETRASAPGPPHRLPGFPSQHSIAASAKRGSRFNRDVAHLDFIWSRPHWGSIYFLPFCPCRNIKAISFCIKELERWAISGRAVCTLSKTWY